MATDGDSRKLSDLRVVDLRVELEKRGLDKSGNKANLTDKLQKALISEGHNPDEYNFDMADKKPAKRISTSAKSEDAAKKDDKPEKEELLDKDDSKNETSDSTEDQGNVLTIETPSLDTTREGKEGESVMKKIEHAESPLHLSIGEEEENLLLNSGDEQEHADSVDKNKDEKNGVSNIGGSSDWQTTKDTNHPETASNEFDDKDEAHEGKRDEKSKSNDANSSPRRDSTTSETSSRAVPATSTNSTPASGNDHSKVDKNKSMKSNPGRSLWVTNLLPSTRAQELKHLLSRYGKVIGAKVVQSSRYPRTRCYGYVTMETRAAADLCIEKLNNTELKGHIIRVAKVRPEHSLPLKTSPKMNDDSDKSKNKSPADKQIADKVTSTIEKKKPIPIVLKVEATSSAEKKKDEKPPVKKESKERDIQNSRGSSRKERSLSAKSTGRREKKSDVLTFDKIREERERQRARERERAMREEEIRRREAQRAREIEKRQREEALRLEREREKLRIERERLDRQRQEILRLERERQKLEREKLEQEKQELRRQQMRLEEARSRPLKRPAVVATANYSREGAASYSDDRKRVATERHYEKTPPPPRFDVSAREPIVEVPIKKEISKDYKSRIAYNKRTEEYTKRSDYKREFPTSERHSSTGHMVHAVNTGGPTKYESSASYVNREREIREPNRREAMVPNVPPPRISKETRYSERTNERSPVSYPPIRDERERRPISEHHAKSDIRSSREHRYGEPSPNMKESARYREGNSWHSNDPPPSKPYGGMSGSASSSRESWSKSDNWRPMATGSNERWVANSSSRIMISGSSGVPSTLYTGNSSSMSGMGTGLSCPPPPGSSSYSMDRFDSYKSMNNPRKY